jgi:hypothetical protein
MAANLGDGPNYERCQVPVNSKRSRRSTTETVTSRYLSGDKPEFALTTGPVTVAALLVAHVALHDDVPFPLLAGIIILSIALPRSRSMVAVALSALYGLVLLPVGLIYAILKRNDPGEYLTRLLAKVVSLLDDVQLPAWAASPAPVSAPAHDGDMSQGNPVQTAPARSADLLPPAVIATRLEREPYFDLVFQELSSRRPNGRTDVVDLQPRGRHAKLASEQESAEELATA